MSTFGKSGQKDRTSDHTRGCDLGIIGHEAGLDAIEQVLLDNGGSCDLDDFRGGLQFAGLGGTDVVLPAADIDGVSQTGSTYSSTAVQPFERQWRVVRSRCDGIDTSLSACRPVETRR